MQSFYDEKLKKKIFQLTIIYHLYILFLIKFIFIKLN